MNHVSCSEFQFKLNMHSCISWLSWDISEKLAFMGYTRTLESIVFIYDGYFASVISRLYTLECSANRGGKFGTFLLNNLHGFFFRANLWNQIKPNANPMQCVLVDFFSNLCRHKHRGWFWNPSFDECSKGQMEETDVNWINLCLAICLYFHNMRFENKQAKFNY